MVYSLFKFRMLSRYKKIKGDSKEGWVSLVVTLLLMACSASDEQENVMPGQLQTVTAKLNFSLPSRIVAKHLAKTRMAADIVQADGTEDEFRGIDDVHLFCFDQEPTESSVKIGSVIEMKTTGDDVEEVTQEDYSLCQEINIPVGTSHFAFYARAADAPRTHEERMRYGIIETIGLDKSNYQGNSGIRFRPVPICNSTEPLGGSKAGQALLRLLNELVNITGPEEAPNDSLATVNNIYLDEAYKRLTSLKVLSSFGVQAVLGFLHQVVHQKMPDDQGVQLAAAIVEKIADCCEAPEPDDKTVTLKEEYQGFPDDIHLPAGAARIEWNEEKSRFEVPDVQAYGKSLDIMSINDYAYPMNLQYQVFSDIVVSDTLVMYGLQDQETAVADASQYKNWEELIETGYEDALKVVQPTTQSVAMVQQVEYAVGRLALSARFTTDNVYDADNRLVSVGDGTFTLKGYIVAGQREVDFDFQPVEGSPEYAIYDTDLNGGPQDLKRKEFSGTDYILGLGTSPNQNILLAMELVNNGVPFQGADGVIATGATFYLVAEMAPEEGQGYSAGSLDQIFSKDRGTQVFLTITSLASATYGLPDLEVPHPTFGVSVSLKWGEGFWFDDVEL